MNALPYRKLTPIAIDAGARQIKAVQLSHTPRGCKVEAAVALLRLTSGGVVDAGEADRLCGVLNRQGFHKCDAALAIGSQNLLASTIQLPPRISDQDLQQVVQIELARANRCDPGSFEMSYWQLPAQLDENTNHAMAVACPHATANTLMDQFDSSALNVIALGTACRALANAAILTAPDAESVAVLDIGWSSATLVMVHHQAIVYQRVLDKAGIGLVHDALARRFDLDDDMTDYLLAHLGLATDTPNDLISGEDRSEVQRVISAHFEAVARELQVCFPYGLRLFTDQPPAVVMLAGGGAAIPGVDTYLANLLGLSVRVVVPGDLADCSSQPDRVATDPALVTAMGLALLHTYRHGHK